MVNIAENKVHKALHNAETWINDLYDGRANALVLSGPAGIGKTHLAHTVAQQRDIPICAPRPGTARGLIRALHDLKDEPIILFDDLDWVWSNEAALNDLKVALDSKPHRILSYTVGADENNSQLHRAL